MNYDNYQDYEPKPKNILKSLGFLKKVGKLTFKLVRKKLLISSFFGPLLIILVIILFLMSIYFYGYSILFLMPKTIVKSKLEENPSAKIVTIFNMGKNDDGWTEEKDQELHREYLRLGNKWLETVESKSRLKERLAANFSYEIEQGYIVSEEEQASSYKLPWAVLAAIDRVVGDPIINPDLTVRVAKPQYHYDLLKPKLVWDKKEIIKYMEWEECETTCSTDEASGQESCTTTCWTETETIKEQIQLLDRAETFEGTFRYVWEKQIINYNQGEKRVTLTYYEPTSVIREGPFYIELQDLIESYGLNPEKDAELVLELAMNYDDEYFADSQMLGNQAIGLSVDLSKRYFNGTLGTVVWPLDNRYNNISSPFGWRIHPIFKDRRFHTGIDLPAPKNTNVVAIQNGIVIHTGWLGGFGKTVIVDHGDFKSLYCHLNNISAKNGDEVSSGTLIGYVGNTGYSTGPHLHLEIRLYENGKERVVDPLNLYN